ncbi:T9SS type A sorting domain-containing protein [Marivirga salinae]|uniref:T9SS type A sorting domain-containing protein n=1 Tax=Marivirga salinarum TaxID=3059078 RepID=A0AA51RA57_9BACT|nr:T9SS type A sorting domain-containing protein [Marivirga sp. BDSF4-3]WMN12887.1 T9SS type A sorting domain-containing protein [Marivirga sp. BDSF4-3]
MKRFYTILTVISISLFSPIIVFSQAGPAGVDTNLQLWLRGDRGLVSSDGSVSEWQDQSGNANDFTQVTTTGQPSVFPSTPGLNGLTSLDFDGSDDFLSDEDGENYINGNSAFSLFIVIQSDISGTDNGFLRTSPNNNNDEFFSLRYDASGANGGGSNVLKAGVSNRNVETSSGRQSTAAQFLGLQWQAATDAEIYINDLEDSPATADNGTASATSPISGADFVYLGNGPKNFWNGKIAEVIFFTRKIDPLERILVQNYLSSKYNIAFSTASNDKYNGDEASQGDYDFGVIGLANDGINPKRSTAQADGLSLTENGTTLSNGDYIFAGYKLVNNVVNDSDLGGVTGLQARWFRDWYFDITDSDNSSRTDFTFDIEDAGFVTQDLSSASAADYILLFRSGTSGSWTEVSTASSFSNTNNSITFNNIDPQEGYYTLGTKNNETSSIGPNPPETWYSYKSGDWDDPNTWTLDGSNSPLLVNPGNNIPSTDDNVVITLGKTVNIQEGANSGQNNISINGIEVIGRLNLTSSTGHNFTTIKGNGRIRMQGDVSGIDNFPAGDASLFADANAGGTLEIYGSGIDLTTGRTFNNIDINMSTSTDIVTLLSDYTLNGSLTINQGDFRINNTSSTTRLSLLIKENVLVQSTASISVGTANAYDGGASYYDRWHKMDVQGDFTNNGSVRLTNLSIPDYANPAANGAVTLSFSALNNSTFFCGGTTDLYNLVLNKGTDDTYILTVNASDKSHFGLFGVNNNGFATTNPTALSNKALWLANGTLRLKGKTHIPSLTEGGNDFPIGGSARLWLDDPDVFVSATANESNSWTGFSHGAPITVNNGGGNQGLYLYGKLQVDAGKFLLGEAEAINFRDEASGQIIVNGGELEATQIAISSFATTGTYSFIQSGGVVRINERFRGGDNSRYSLHLADPNMVVNLSGGEIIIQDRTNLGGLTIDSDPNNISVTGGLLTIDDRNGINEIITINSTAPFYNFILKDQNVTLDNNFTIINDFTLNNNINGDADIFNTLDFNVTVGGDFVINSGATYNNGANSILTINGGNDATIEINTGATQSISNLTINKGPLNDLVVTNGAASALNIPGNFRLENGNFLLSTFNTEIAGNVYLADTVSSLTETGKLILNGSVLQTITSEQGVVHNLDLDNNANLSLAGGELVIRKTLSLINGVLDINQYRLRLAGPDASISVTNPGTTRMIETSGLSSDRGVALYADANEIITFPFGSAGKYTPAEITLSNVTDDGYIILNPVNSILLTLEGGNDKALEYYWRLRNEGFTDIPSGTMIFDYDGTDDQNAGNLTPGRVVNVTREQLDGNVDKNNNRITITTAYTLLEGDYTAANNSLFNGTLRTLYAIQNGVWHDPDTWSEAQGGSPINNTNQLPGPGDIVVIGSTTENFSVAITDTDANGDPIAAYEPISIARLAILRYSNAESSLVTIKENGDVHDFGILTNIDPDNPVTSNHSSKIILTGNTLPAGDLGEFLTAPNTIWTYSRRFPGTNTTIIDQDDVNLGNTDFTSYTVGNTITEYPNLQFEYSNLTGGQITLPDVDITVNGDIRFFKGPNRILLNSSGVDGDVFVKRNINFNNGAVYVQFPFTGANERLLTVEGDINFLGNNANPTRFEVIDGVSTLNHKLRLQGNIINPGNNSNFIFFRATNKATVDLEFFGAGNSSFDLMPNIPALNRIIMDKGIDQSLSTTIFTNFTLGGDASGSSDTKPVVLENGTLNLNNAAINIDLNTGGDDFLIPSSAGLTLTQGQANVGGNDTGILLNGGLQISGGTLDMNDGTNNGNNYIEYSPTGNASLTINSGTLTVGSQIRRSLITNTGVLNYTQTGGTVLVGNNAAPVANRGVFEITGGVGDFTHTAGSFTVLRQNSANPSVAALILNPATSNLTGSTITLGDVATPASQNNFGINSNIALNELVINGNNNPTMNLQVRPLTMNGTLTVNSGATFDANGRNLILKGDFMNEGAYLGTNNTTFFSNLTATTYSGIGTATFNNLTKNQTGIVNIGKEITVDGTLHIGAGTFADNGNSINVSGTVINDAVHTSSGGNGIIFNGTTQQELRRSGQGTGTFGIVTINNPEGVQIPDGNDFSFIINNSLRLQGGVFDIGGNLLTLSASANIEEVSPFGISNMVETNSSLSDNGLRKFLNPINSTTNFTFPIGQSKYTPAIFTINNSSAGSITVRPTNEIHPAIVEDVEAPNDEITDRENVLQYYWTIEANGISGFDAYVMLKYRSSDIEVTSPYSENNYIPARVFESNNTWDKAFSQAAFDEANQEMTFPFSGANDALITGDYTAGVSVDNLDNSLNGAIPNVIEEFSTDESGGGNFDESTAWSEAIPLGGPLGAQITIKAGDVLRLNNNSVRLFKTIIEAGAILEVPETIGHRLGIVEGTGTLRLISDGNSVVLPAGYYADFFTCGGGSLEYAGAGNYDVMGAINTVQNLTFSGSGNRILSNSNFTVCNDLTVSGPIVSNSDGVMVSVQRDMLVNSGGYNNGAGNLQIDRNMVVDGGTFNGGNGNNKTVVGNVNINSGILEIGNAGNFNIQGNLVRTGGAFNSGSSTSSVVMNGSSVQTISGDFTGTNDFYNLEINNGSGISQAGNLDLDRQLRLTNGIITTNGNDFTFDADASASPAKGSNASYINGRVKKILNSGSFTFPIGKGSRWGHASVIDPSASGFTWEAEYYNGDPGADPEVDNKTPSNTAVKKISGNEYWRISSGAAPAGTTARVGLSWDAASDVSSNEFERADLVVMAWNDGNGNWDDFGATAFNDLGSTEGSFQSSNSVSFTEKVITLGSTDPNNPLPVEFTFFIAENKFNRVELKWQTASEINNEFFEVQRSFDGKEYEAIGIVEGNGNSNQTIDYDFKDFAPLAGESYYRLRQVDYDGAFEYSEVVRVRRAQAADLIAVPNPTQSQNIHLRLLGFHGEQKVQVTIFDIQGRRHYQAIHNPSDLNKPLPINQNLNSGIYIVDVKQGNINKKVRLMVR